MNKLKFWKRSDRDQSTNSQSHSHRERSESIGSIRKVSTKSKSGSQSARQQVQQSTFAESDVFEFKEPQRTAAIEGIDIAEYHESSEVFQKSLGSQYIEDEMPFVEGFKGIEASYVSISNDYIEILQDQDYLLSQEMVDLYKYISDNKYGINDNDREWLEEFVVKGIPDNLRRRYWLSVSGAFGYLKNYGPGYYATLCSEVEENYPLWPHPDYAQINKDIQRTFSDEAFFKEVENQNKIKRLLRAYVRRNPIQGYIQSMNYIAGRLLQVLSEEEAFWVFVLIMEKYLPIDYMLDGLTGAMTDQKVFEQIVNYKYPQILQKLKQLKLQHDCDLTARTIFQNCVISWFQSLFTYNLPMDTSFAIMDLFLLKGDNTIFFIGLALLSTIKKDIMECNSIDQIQSKILKGTKNKSFTNYRSILKKSQKYKSMSPFEIIKFRDFFQNEVRKEQKIAGDRAKKQNGRKTQNTLNDRKQEFLKEFPNFAISRKGEKRVPLVSMSHKDPKTFFSCNKNWQICSFDFTYRKVLAESFQFRVQKFNIVEDHFYGYNDLGQAGQRRRAKNLITKFEDLVIFRGNHICTRTFCQQFAKMFTAASETECDKLINLQILKKKKIEDRQCERYFKKLKEYVDNFYQKEQRQIKRTLVDEERKAAIAQQEQNEFQMERNKNQTIHSTLLFDNFSRRNTQKQQASKKDIPLSKSKSDVSEPGLKRGNYSSTNSLIAHDASPSTSNNNPSNYSKMKHQASYDVFDFHKLKKEFRQNQPQMRKQGSYLVGSMSGFLEANNTSQGGTMSLRKHPMKTEKLFVKKNGVKTSFESESPQFAPDENAVTEGFIIENHDQFVNGFEDHDEEFYEIEFLMPACEEEIQDQYIIEQQDIHPAEERKERYSRSSNIFEYTYQPQQQGFKLILSKRDIELMFHRGVDKGIFSMKNASDEMTNEDLQHIAAQHFLSITKVERSVVGDEIYDQLIEDNFNARDQERHQLMKEMDFDIILNTCKQRQEFKIYIDLLVNKLNVSQQEDMSFSMEQIIEQQQESLFNENSMFSHRESFCGEIKNEVLEQNLSIPISQKSGGSMKRRLSIKKMFSSRKKFSQNSIVKKSSLQPESDISSLPNSSPKPRIVNNRAEQIQEIRKEFFQSEIEILEALYYARLM